MDALNGTKVLGVILILSLIGIFLGFYLDQWLIGGGCFVLFYLASLLFVLTYPDGTTYKR